MEDIEEVLNKRFLGYTFLSTMGQDWMIPWQAHFIGQFLYRENLIAKLLIISDV